MFRSILSAVAILACSSALALADPKDDIQSAAQKLAGSDSYGWTSTVTGGRGPSTSEGKTQSGLTSVSVTMRGTEYDIFIKGDKAAIKTADGWKSAAEILADADNGGGFSPEMFVARMTQSYKTPAVQASEMVDKLQNVQKGDDAYTADLSEDAAKTFLTFGRRPNANADANAGPQVSNAKGSIKFWIKDGALIKDELHVTGTVSFNGNDRDVDRTTTIEFKDVGSTTIDVPAEAQAKLNAPASQPAAQ